MTLSAPKKWTFLLGAALWLVGLLSPWIPGMDAQLFQGLSVGYVLVMLGGIVLIVGNGFEGF